MIDVAGFPPQQSRLYKRMNPIFFGWIRRFIFVQIAKQKVGGVGRFSDVVIAHAKQTNKRANCKTNRRGVFFSDDRKGRNVTGQKGRN